ncbi:MAG: hypothetical protein OXN92_12585, partial [Gammaproteobacteria bacterium]|nr:hypothetical protein [Gammaproteobacteria bacterium]
MKLLQHLDLKLPQLAVGDDEEVPAPARRVKEGHPPELLLKPAEVGPAAAVLPGLQSLELGPKIVQKQRPDHLQDVLLG